ncbi:hypothetical protein BaRGS_00001441 [Batillaria attramentaria]|uniref:Uncharacterized protein n=1 Tax=Batillaria attramentaria TaxID=370345 RepID=A0ABD0M767_9CAEN
MYRSEENKMKAVSGIPGKTAFKRFDNNKSDLSASLRGKYGLAYAEKHTCSPSQMVFYAAFLLPGIYRLVMSRFI